MDAAEVVPFSLRRAPGAAAIGDRQRFAYQAGPGYSIRMPATDTGLLALDPTLRDTARVRPLAAGDRADRRELVALLLTGVGAALLTTFGDAHLGIPGHHIVLVVFPMALGFALVPRRMAGTVMGAAGSGTLALLGAAGAHLPGPGALTGFVLAGPMLDLALGRGGRGWRLYAAFIAAGAATNALAFLARGVTKSMGIGGAGGGRAFAAWLPVAVWTYAIAGVLAGLLSAAVWFHFRGRE